MINVLVRLPGQSSSLLRWTLTHDCGVRRRARTNLIMKHAIGILLFNSRMLVSSLVRCTAYPKTSPNHSSVLGALSIAASATAHIQSFMCRYEIQPHGISRNGGGETTAQHKYQFRRTTLPDARRGVCVGRNACNSLVKSKLAARLQRASIKMCIGDRTAISEPMARAKTAFLCTRGLVAVQEGTHIPGCGWPGSFSKRFRCSTLPS